MDYTQITPIQEEEMLKVIGVSSINELFSPIPENARLTGLLDLPAAASELELKREAMVLAEENDSNATHICFMGAGAYDHFIPTVVDHVSSQSEFLTAYTPYQAEASQGSLQVFYEFQTQIARLTGMDIANASLYEAATAVTEAVLLAVNTTRKKRVLIAESLNPDYRSVLETYCAELDITLDWIPANSNGVVDPKTLEEIMSDDVAGVMIQSPNFFGLIEDWAACFDIAHTNSKTLAIAVFNPIACGLLKKPGECGADIAVGEGQPLGNPIQYGGPYLGLFAANKKFMRKMPGRLVGKTVDTEGRDTYCLVLQTREQHIKRAKATSNICTNQGLVAIRASVFLNALGPQGLAEMAEQSYHKSHYFATQICNLPGYDLKFGSMTETPFFNEFVITCPCSSKDIISKSAECGFLLGPDLNSKSVGQVGEDNDLLICVTEKRTREELDTLVEFLKDFCTT